MNKNRNGRILLLLSVLLVLSATITSQSRSVDNVWERIDKTELRLAGNLPSSYETFRLNKSALQALLKQAPEEYSGGKAVVLSLPMPDGSFSRFEIEHSLVVERGLLVRYPELGETYRGRGIDDRTATARFDFMPSGFHSMILSANGTVIVDPYSVGDTENYISFFKRDQPKSGKFECEVTSDAGGFESFTKPKKNLDLRDFLPDVSEPEVLSGTQLRTYRLAVAATNEYCVAVGGNTVAGSLAAQVVVMNRVNGVYNRDLAIHMNIIANNNLIVYAGNNMSCGGACNSSNDPYTNNDGFAMLDQNQNNVTSVIGSANYDIGHVFSTGGGGVATLGSPCSSSIKARGVTGLGSPLGDPFAIDYVAHEIGHQFGANHTFNSTVGNCGGNREPTAAFEPGSGITIMGYAGLCDAQDLALHSIDTFHVKSLEEIVSFSQSGGGNSCPVITSSGNILPVVTGPGNFIIPRNSAFALTASATDGNGDTLTYDWQEYDLGSAATTVPNTDADGIKPIFRPYPPTASGTRNFPALQYILNNANVPPSSYDCGRPGNPCLLGELLPSVSRTMTFKVIVRDNRANAGGINTNTSSLVTVNGASGPFTVTSPNTGVSYVGNSTQTVTWNVAGTSGSPVNAANVRILFSINGGSTFPTVLVASTANDGSQTVTIPNTPTTTARIKVEAVGNIFFDISNTNFTVTAGSPTPTASPTSTPTSTPTPPGVIIPVTLPAISASPGSIITVPVTVGDLTGNEVISYDFQVTFDPEIIQPATPAFDVTGTLSSSMSITPNTDFPGHLIIAAFQAPNMTGSGTLINLRFVALGEQGQSSELALADYTDPNTEFHPAFQFNEGVPGRTITDGSVLVVDGLINGTVTYGNAASPPKYISNASVTGTGSPSVSTTTAAPGGTAGQYSLGGFSTGSYTVSLSKTTGQNGITSNDAARIAQHVSGALLLTSDNQRVTADVSSNGVISSNDAAQIARFVASLGPPIGLTGQWRFFVPPGPTFPVGSSPTTRTYPSVMSTIGGEDYIGLLIGEVTGNWTPSGARPVGSGPEKSTAVELPNLLTESGKEVVIPVKVDGVENKDVISYEFDLRYDPSVIQPQADPLDLSGTVSRGLMAVVNAEQPGILRVVVYGPMPIDKNGLLLNLRFTAVGEAGSVSPLTFEKIMFNEGEPRVTAANAFIELSTPSE
ncbi:MAG: reprolysin-like metallopeptidase [Pyrinomonadaceae bacterium]